MHASYKNYKVIRSIGGGDDGVELEHAELISSICKCHWKTHTVNVNAALI